MKPRIILIGFIACLILSLPIAFTVFSFIKDSQRPPLPVLGHVQDFVLRDSTGQEFNSDQLKGKVWIASFFFTTCSDICPLISKNMAALSRTFGKVEKISLVSITVNPEQDSPETLALYAKKLKGNNMNWYFLTGERSAITNVAVDSFKVGDIKEPIFHSSYLPLVDSNGFIRGYYDGTKQEEINRLFKDAAHLAHR